jgi:plastocyanin
MTTDPQRPHSDPSGAPPGEPPTPAASGPGRRLLVAALVVVGLLVVGAVAATLLGDSRGDTIAVDVAPGTQERLEAGEAIELLPRTLRVEVGDELVITNRDDHAHQVGPYTVAPGQVLRQQFTTPGTIEGVCTLHPSGEISIVVR